jgi:hypothetical protein
VKFEVPGYPVGRLTFYPAYTDEQRSHCAGVLVAGVKRQQIGKPAWLDTQRLVACDCREFSRQQPDIQIILWLAQGIGEHQDDQELQFEVVIRMMEGYGIDLRGDDCEPNARLAPVAHLPETAESLYGCFAEVFEEDGA